MKLDGEDDFDQAGGVASAQDRLAPYLALDRLLRYARSEALSQNREKAASFIEAAIVSLADTGGLSRH